MSNSRMRSSSLGAASTQPSKPLLHHQNSDQSTSQSSATAQATNLNDEDKEHNQTPKLRPASISPVHSTFPPPPLPAPGPPPPLSRSTTTTTTRSSRTSSIGTNSTGTPATGTGTGGGSVKGSVAGGTKAASPMGGNLSRHPQPHVQQLYRTPPPPSESHLPTSLPGGPPPRSSSKGAIHHHQNYLQRGESYSSTATTSTSSNENPGGGGPAGFGAGGYNAQPQLVNMHQMMGGVGNYPGRGPQQVNYQQFLVGQSQPQMDYAVASGYQFHPSSPPPPLPQGQHFVASPQLSHQHSQQQQSYPYTPYYPVQIFPTNPGSSTSNPSSPNLNPNQTSHQHHHHQGSPYSTYYPQVPYPPNPHFTHQQSQNTEGVVAAAAGSNLDNNTASASGREDVPDPQGAYAEPVAASSSSYPASPNFYHQLSPPHPIQNDPTSPNPRNQSYYVLTPGNAPAPAGGHERWNSDGSSASTGAGGSDVVMYPQMVDPAIQQQWLMSMGMGMGVGYQPLVFIPQQHHQQGPPAPGFAQKQQQPQYQFPSQQQQQQLGHPHQQQPPQFLQQQQQQQHQHFPQQNNNSQYYYAQPHHLTHHPPASQGGPRVQPGGGGGGGGGGGLMRGEWAKKNLREAVEGSGGDVVAGGGKRTGVDAAKSGGGGGGGQDARMPKPPAHSPHALWVGNVPSDASHAEILRFFLLRPPPVVNPVYANRLEEYAREGIDINVVGVESVHLIVRSNCAFVNYTSNVHLQHSIQVSHNVSLRPFDPRCKELVCRVRKKDDDTKSGVGAQRTGGMHKSYVRALGIDPDKDKEREKSKNSLDPSTAASNPTSPTTPTTPHDPHRNSTTSTLASTSTGGTGGTGSTTSSFLSKYFPKRYFVLKSHDEEDLKLSVESGLWATQSHNEPVLDQAFRSCREGVFLIFSANKSGEWFGYGRMVSAITPGSASSHRTSTASGLITAESPTTSRHPAILEDSDEESPSQGPPKPTRPSLLFTESEGRLADKSPMPLTPAGPSGEAGTPVSENPPQHASAPAALNQGKNATLSVGGHAYVVKRSPVGEEEADRHGSLDPKALAAVRGHLPPNSTALERVIRDQLVAGSSDAPAEMSEDGVLRKDTMPSLEEKVKRLELDDLDDLPPNSPSGAGWGRPFRIEWIKVSKLPFTRTKHIRNPFNSNREIKISRDGTEVEPYAGEQLISEFWRVGSPDAPTASDAGSDGSTPPAAQQQKIPSGLVG
ncbi:hypothetical protein T439DRAFT_383505 [Meredithblackwellia eburnea MCA 4105]